MHLPLERVWMDGQPPERRTFGCRLPNLVVHEDRNHGVECVLMSAAPIYAASLSIIGNCPRDLEKAASP